jgi:NADH-quinone oxidoreductase subunit N
MEFSINDLMPAAAEVFLLCAVSVILIVDLFVSDRRRILTYGLTQLALLVTAMIAARSIGGESVYAFSDMFVGDALGYVLKTGVCLSVAVGLAYSRAYLVPRGMYRGEYFVLAMLAVLGMMVMISANHLQSL